MKNIKNYVVQFVTFILVLMCAMAPVRSSAQEFFLDSWIPKNIKITAFDTISQTKLASTVTVTIDAGTTITKVSKYVYGHNAAVWGGKLEQSTQLVKDLNALQPQIIRWPGGNMSNDYFWNATSKVTCPNDLPPATASSTPTDPLLLPPHTFSYSDMWYGANKNSWTMGLDSYYSLLSKINSTGIICVNYAYARYGTSADPVMAAAKLAADWVRYDNGRTRYWEIGNENFGNWETGYIIDQKLNKDGQPITISGDLYGKHCKVFIDEMRKAAKEVGNDIKIGVVAIDSYVSYNAVMKDWNIGMMKQVGNMADFMIVHSYHTPYNENSTVPTILNSMTKANEIMTYVNSGLKTNINHLPLPMALTEWNIFAVKGGQACSYINGMHATLVTGELIKNKYGQSTRWDLVNGWDNGNSHGLLADGETGIARYTPRAPFFYMYYFQKYFGDKMIQSTVAGSSDIVTYASKFSSGQSSVILVNKGTTEKIVNIKLNNFSKGNRYYYYLLTGGTDNGDFSRKVYVNGKTTTSDGGGPVDYETLKPYGTDISGEILVSIPKWATLFLLVENDKNMSSQTIDFNPIPEKIVGDTDFLVTATASSRLPVEFSSSNPKVAKVVNNSVQIVGVGSCNIIANQDGNTIYNSAVQVAQTLTVSKGNQIISFSGLQSKTNVDPLFSPGAVANSGLSCTYTSSNTSVAVIVNGQVQIKGIGTAIITAKQAGNINYNAAADVSQELLVTFLTSAETISISNDFEIFPNPAADIVTIKFNSSDKDFIICNSIGQTVYSHEKSGKEVTIPTNNIGSTGIYFVKSNSITRKLIIAN